jgi:DNA-binding beta-propeller fold protein YncE
VRAHGDDALTIINEATCNATVRTGCGQPAPATMSGADPFSIAASPATNPVYVGNARGFAGLPWTISMINDTACNTLVSSGCRPNPPTITMKFLAYSLAVTQATNTLFATNNSTASGQPGSTVSVIDGATVTTGCGQTPPTVTVGNAINAVEGMAVNPATDTIHLGKLSGPDHETGHCHQLVVMHCPF